MGMTKRIFYPQPSQKLTKEEQEKNDQLWKILCETGHVCTTDPSDTTDPIEEMAKKLREDPNARLGTTFDYCGPLTLKDFRRQLAAHGTAKEEDTDAK